MSTKKGFQPSQSKKQNQNGIGKQQLFYTEDFKLKIVNERSEERRVGKEC